MSFRSILATLRSTPKPPRGRAPGRRAGFRPRLEPLEDRTVPATFMVLNLADAGAGSLRQAVIDANTLSGADTIDFADGLVGTIGLTTGQLSIIDGLTIDGPGAGQLTVSGNHQSRIFSIGAGKTVAIDGLTIADGRVTGSPAHGGGILNSGGILALTGVVLANNEAVGTPGGVARGGAVANLSTATLTVTDCLFTGNQSRGGSGGAFGNSGAIANLGSRLTVSRTAFTANQAMGGVGGGQALGGGIVNVMGSVATVTDSTFVGNQAIAGDGSGGNGLATGGGLYNNRSTLTVENCTILENLSRGGSDNTRSDRVVGAAGGGGIFNVDGALLFLTRSSVIGNRAVGGSNNTSTGGDADVGTAFGGGLNNVGTATVTDCLFEDNEARGGSGNRGDGISFQFVGTGTGGGIATSARSLTVEHNVATLHNVTIRANRAVGGNGNTAGTFVDAGIGGGLGNNGSNPYIPVSGGSTVTLQDSTVSHNQAVGGRGGAALGGGVANTLGGVSIISGSTLSHNRANGGDGDAAGDGFGGGLYNGPASTHSSNAGAETRLTVRDSRLAHNVARGGDAATGARGGDGLGGGLWNGGTASIFDTDISYNRAVGGDGADGSDGGTGLGGGAFNAAAAALRLEGCTVTENHANGGEGGIGGSDGEGIGGGVYNLGLFDFDLLTEIFENHASSSHDDVFDLWA